MGPLHGSFYGALLRAIGFRRHSLAYKSTGLIINFELGKKQLHIGEGIGVSLTCDPFSCTYWSTHYVTDMKVSVSYVCYIWKHVAAIQPNMAHTGASTMYRMQILTLRGLQERGTCSEQLCGFRQWLCWKRKVAQTFVYQYLCLV